MSKKHWIEKMKEIAADFEHADVRQFTFKRINGEVACTVTTQNADNDLVTWELVDDAVSADRWRKVSAEARTSVSSLTKTGLYLSPGEPALSCPDKALLRALKDRWK